MRKGFLLDFGTYPFQGTLSSENNLNFLREKSHPLESTCGLSIVERRTTTKGTIDLIEYWILELTHTGCLRGAVNTLWLHSSSPWGARVDTVFLVHSFVEFYWNPRVILTHLYISYFATLCLGFQIQYSKSSGCSNVLVQIQPSRTSRWMKSLSNADK